jgi:cell division protein FtsL
MTVAMKEQQHSSEVTVADQPQWFAGRGLAWATSVLLLLVIASALGVIYSSYVSRQLFSELQQDKRQAMRLEENWGRLLLEQSTWAAHARIERLAKSELNMIVPEPASIVVVKQ